VGGVGGWEDMPQRHVLQQQYTVEVGQVPKTVLECCITPKAALILHFRPRYAVVLVRIGATAKALQHVRRVVGLMLQMKAAPEQVPTAR